MSVSLIRIDDRVIHGQTLTRWSKILKVDSIMVVSDAVANDELRKKVLKGAAGSYIKVGIFTVSEAAEKMQKAIQSPKGFFIISDSPVYFEQLARQGVDLGGKVINVGSLNAPAKDGKHLGNARTLDKEMYDSFEYLAQNGYTMDFRLIPSDGSKDWNDIKKAYDKQ